MQSPSDSGPTPAPLAALALALGARPLLALAATATVAVVQHRALRGMHSAIDFRAQGVNWAQTELLAAEQMLPAQQRTFMEFKLYQDRHPDRRCQAQQRFFAPHPGLRGAGSAMTTPSMTPSATARLRQRIADMARERAALQAQLDVIRGRIDDLSVSLQAAQAQLAQARRDAGERLRRGRLIPPAAAEPDCRRRRR